jgi:ubiquinone/menaquinone biosynthesis C-methylase UbiE
MDFQELAAILRCLDCGGQLRAGETGFKCPGCGRAYRLVEGIPIMMDSDPEAEVWESYFRRLAETLGDAESANRYFNLRSFRIVRDNLLELIGKPHGLRILDIGCGTGHFSQSLAEDNRVVGVDISFEMAAYARKKGLATVQSSGKRLPFAAASFDLVIANNVIQSFRDGGPFVAEAARVLGPGGRLLLSATNGQNLAMAFLRPLERRKYRHLGVYSAEALRRLLLEAGLGVASLLFFYFPTGKVAAFPGDARVRFFQKRLATTVAAEAVKPE